MTLLFPAISFDLLSFVTWFISPPATRICLKEAALAVIFPRWLGVIGGYFADLFPPQTVV